MHPNSLANLELGRQSRAIAKKKVLVSLTPETIAYLKGFSGRNSISNTIEEIVTAIRNGEYKRQ